MSEIDKSALKHKNTLSLLTVSFAIYIFTLFAPMLLLIDVDPTSSEEEIMKEFNFVEITSVFEWFLFGFGIVMLVLCLLDILADQNALPYKYAAIGIFGYLLLQVRGIWLTLSLNEEVHDHPRWGLGVGIVSFTLSYVIMSSALVMYQPTNTGLRRKRKLDDQLALPRKPVKKQPLLIHQGKKN